MSKMKKIFIILTLLYLVPIIFGVIMYAKLPNMMPIHWNVNGEINGYISKHIFVFAFPIVGYLFNVFLVYITEKNIKDKKSMSKMINLLYFILPFIVLGAMSFTYSAALGYNINIERVVFIPVGIIFILIGNYLPKTRANGVIGIRIPTTLKSEENWRITHRFAGRLYIVAGVLIMLYSIFLDNEYKVIVSLATVVIVSVVPMIYSIINRGV